MASFGVCGLDSVSFSLSSCHSEPESPEAQIRALIAKAEKAAEEKDASTLKDLISEKYQGKEKEKKTDLVAAVVYQLVRHQSIHLLTQVREITFPEESARRRPCSSPWPDA